MFRLQENVPEVYVKHSRDFQVFCRLYDIINNTIRFNAKSTTNLLDPLNVSDKMLPLLATKVGFFPKNKYNSEALREVISAFPYIIKYKGSKKGIEMALNAVLRLENNYKDSRVYVDSEKSVVNIYTETKIQGEALLRDVLSYILPIGYDLTVSTFKKSILDKSLAQVQLSETVIRDSYNSDELSVVSNTDVDKALKSVGSYTTTEVLKGN